MHEVHTFYRNPTRAMQDLMDKKLKDDMRLVHMTTAYSPIDGLIHTLVFQKFWD